MEHMGYIYILCIYTPPIIYIYSLWEPLLPLEVTDRLKEVGIHFPQAGEEFSEFSQVNDLKIKIGISITINHIYIYIRY